MYKLRSVYLTGKSHSVPTAIVDLYKEGYKGSCDKTTCYVDKQFYGHACNIRSIKEQNTWQFQIKWWFKI